MGRKIAGTILGLIAAFVTISVSQLAMALVMKPPTFEMMQDPVAMRAFVEAMPPWAYLILALGYAIGSLVGGFVAGKTAGGSNNGFLPALIIGIFLTLMGVINFFVSMPGSPIWAIALCLVTYIPFSLLGNKLSGSPRAAAANG
ncbi:MAG TPA: hypothetical protein VFZ23_01760 [Pyrinomonadaceae bacterium]